MITDNRLSNVDLPGMLPRSIGGTCQLAKGTGSKAGGTHSWGKLEPTGERRPLDPYRYRGLSQQVAASASVDRCENLCMRVFMRRVGLCAEESHHLPGRQVLVGEVCDKRQPLWQRPLWLLESRVLS